ncbi:MAG: glycosyltransferase [Lachnospiraceae bacterium]|nr:glycosyltransferase [Lachnospiraceae bacterium]
MEDMEPLVSAIVPVYNGQDYLEKCIESIEEQTYKNLEIIIINDGSTDNTGAVCERLRKRFENIRVIDTEDVGVSAARNAGIMSAEGAFVTFVDADDRLRPKTLQVLYDCIMETGSDVAGCAFKEWEKEEEWQDFLSNRYAIEKPVKYTASDYLKEEILKGNSRCWSKLYRRAAIGKLQFQEGLTIGEDMLFLVKLLPYVRGIAETAYPGYGYYHNPKGAMNRKFTRHYMDQITCWELAREEIRKIDQKLRDQVTIILIMGILLTVGKLAALPLKERRQMKQYIGICHDKLKEESRAAGAYKGLSRGYKIKTKLFLYVPQLYLFLYHMRGK